MLHCSHKAQKPKAVLPPCVQWGLHLCRKYSSAALYGIRVSASAQEMEQSRVAVHQIEGSWADLCGTQCDKQGQSCPAISCLCGKVEMYCTKNCVLKQTWFGYLQTISLVQSAF